MNPTVQVRVDIGGSDRVPHTFLSIIHPDGREVEYGFVPAENLSAAGPGRIDISGPGAGRDRHEYDFLTPRISLSDVDYSRLMERINQSIGNPPNYLLPGTWWPGSSGTNCTGWTADIWNGSGLPNISGVTNSWAWNPYGQAIWIKVSDWWRTAIAPRPRDPNPPKLRIPPTDIKNYLK